MIRRWLFLGVLMMLFLFPIKKVRAGGFNLTSIGSINTSGRQISHWWYTGSDLTLKGEAAPEGLVIVSIDDSETTITADSEGNWVFVPETLSNGDHKIILTSDESTISFTLTMGSENVDWDMVSSGDDEVLPAAGVLFPTVSLTTMGSLLVLISKKIARKN